MERADITQGSGSRGREAVDRRWVRGTLCVARRGVESSLGGINVPRTDTENAVSNLPTAVASTLDELGAKSEGGRWICPHCRTKVFDGDLAGEVFCCRLCCHRMREELQRWGVLDLLAETRRGAEELVQKVVPGVVAREVRLEGDWCVAGPLETTTVSKKTVEEQIEKHHAHHDPPQSAILGVQCIEKKHNRSAELRGVGTLATPTSRQLMKNGTHLEVNRLCTWGPRWRRKNVISKITGHLRTEARRIRSNAQDKLNTPFKRERNRKRAERRAGIGRLRTYILEHESGDSLRAAGWTLVGRSSGGHWSSSRKGRSRRPETEGPKWVYDTAL